MLAVISPAKKLDFDTPPTTRKHTQPEFIDDAETLAKKARSLSRAKLKSLMGISDQLADANYRRFQAFEPPFTLDNAKQAALAFAGDTYVGLDAPTLKADDLQYAQSHLRILSGLYGLLRPLDLIQPYRLEMGIKLPVGGKANLYDFWNGRIAEAINAATAKHKDRTLVNLASNEYIKAVDRTALAGPLVTPVFKEVRDGQAKVLGFVAKRARGMMARWIVENRIDTPDALKKFDAGGYRYQADLSNGENWVFTREQG